MNARRRAPVAVAAIPDRGKRLSDGMLIEASVLARVLGLKVLTLDAKVMLLPAAPRTSSGAIGRGLADAVRSLDEGAAILDDTRRNGSI
jgi:hypothetical protein